MITGLKRRRTKPEYIIMGKNLCMSWLVEQSSQGKGLALKDPKKYAFRHRGIPVVVCESEILEVVPNPKHVLG